jgi:UDPglucose 6-dehydrogenase
MIKYASNAFLATKISFINEMAQLCERANADVSMVAKGMGLDKRIGPRFLNVSIGYGGSCFPKDVAALYKTSTDQAYDFKLIRSVMEVNEQQKYTFFKKITKHLGDNLSGKTIAVLGLAFKDNTDDIRESVAIKLVRMLRGNGANLRVYDPAAMDNTKRVLGGDDIYYAKDSYDAVKGADAVCILTEWADFKNIDLDKVKKLMKGNSMFDGRFLMDQKVVEDAGFIYFTIGKRSNGWTEEGDIVRTALLKNGKQA